MSKKIITLGIDNYSNIDITLYPSGGVSIDTKILEDNDDYKSTIIATTDYLPSLDRFSWVGNFIHRYEIVIDIDW